MKIKISGSGLLYFLSLKALSCRVSPCGNLLQISYELEKKWLRYRLYRVSVVGGVAMAWVACFQRITEFKPKLIDLVLARLGLVCDNMQYVELDSLKTSLTKLHIVTDQAKPSQN